MGNLPILVQGFSYRKAGPCDHSVSDQRVPVLTGVTRCSTKLGNSTAVPLSRGAWREANRNQPDTASAFAAPGDLRMTVTPAPAHDARTVALVDHGPPGPVVAGLAGLSPLCAGGAKGSARFAAPVE